ERGPHKDLAQYLLARFATASGAHRQARELLNEIDIGKLPLPSLAKEKGRMGVLAACRWVMDGGPPQALEQELTAYKKQNLSSAEIREVDRVSERCRSVANLRKKKP